MGNVAKIMLKTGVKHVSMKLAYLSRCPLDSDLVLRLGVSLTEKHSLHVVC